MRNDLKRISVIVVTKSVCYDFYRGCIFLSMNGFMNSKRVRFVVMRTLRSRTKRTMKTRVGKRLKKRVSTGIMCVIRAR